MIFISHSSEETKEIAKKILKRFKRNNIFSLEGELGGGKTTFVKGVADFFLIKNKIKSPTFVIMKKYDIKCKIQNLKHKNKKQNLKLSKIKSSGFKNLYHFDCYRIKNPKEILDLGWEEIIKNSQNVFFVEWGDKIKNILPKRTIHIKFKFLNENERKIILKKI